MAKVIKKLITTGAVNMGELINKITNHSSVKKKLVAKKENKKKK